MYFVQYPATSVDHQFKETQIKKQNKTESDFLYCKKETRNSKAWQHKDSTVFWKFLDVIKIPRQNMIFPLFGVVFCWGFFSTLILPSKIVTSDAVFHIFLEGRMKNIHAVNLILTWRRNITSLTVLLFVRAAVYQHWVMDPQIWLKILISYSSVSLPYFKHHICLTTKQSFQQLWCFKLYPWVARCGITSKRFQAKTPLACIVDKYLRIIHPQLLK